METLEVFKNNKGAGKNYFKIREHSFLARLAARKLKSTNVAMVLGHTIHLYGVSKTAFLTNETWLRHELKHIEQYQKNGVLKFLVQYIWQSTRKGYYNCAFEKEARAAEKDEMILTRFILKEKRQGQA